jgi:hypothetical protein
MKIASQLYSPGEDVPKARTTNKNFERKKWEKNFFSTCMPSMKLIKRMRSYDLIYDELRVCWGQSNIKRKSENVKQKQKQKNWVKNI